MRCHVFAEMEPCCLRGRSTRGGFSDARRNRRRRCGGLTGRVPGFPVAVADTNGAGDTFFGAFLSRIAARGGLEGLTAEEISAFVRFANRAASITTSRPGAIPAMPTLAEVEEGLQ